MNFRFHCIPGELVLRQNITHGVQTKRAVLGCAHAKNVFPTAPESWPHKRGEVGEKNPG